MKAPMTSSSQSHQVMFAELRAEKTLKDESFLRDKEGCTNAIMLFALESLIHRKRKYVLGLGVVIKSCGSIALYWPK
mgnify:CR=1 FL=1